MFRPRENWPASLEVRCGVGGALVQRGVVLFVFCLLSLSITSPNASVAHAQTPDSIPLVMAVVNGDTILSTELDRLLIATHRTMGSTERGEFDYHSLLTRLVNDRLLVQEARALGIDEEPYVLQELNEIRDKDAMGRWVRDHYKPTIEVPEDTIRAHFQRDFFNVQFRVATFKTADDAAAAHAALKDGADMDSLARANSIDPYRDRGGLRKLEWYAEMEPVLRDLNDSLAEGELSAPFAYRSIHAVARIERTAPTDTADYATVKPRIERWLKQKASQDAWNAFVDEQKEHFGVDIVAGALDAIRSDSAKLFTPEFAKGTDEIVVQIGDAEGITDAQLRGKTGHNAMTSGDQPFESILQTSLNDIVEERVLMAAARRDGYYELPEVIDRYNRGMDSAVAATYITETITPQITFRRDEFESYYQDHLENFRESGSVQCDRMIVESEDAAAEIYERLKEGADYQYMARQYGVELATPAETSEWLVLSTFPDAVREELEALRIGESASPQQTSEGWLILKIKARREGELLPIDRVESRIRSAMFQTKFNEELDKVLVLLKENSTIEMNDEAIQKYFGDGS